MDSGARRYTDGFRGGNGSFFHGIAFGHVEAGLRTGDKLRPFPEEINRRLADVVADIYFAPTEGACQALLHEGCKEQNIYVTGNTVVDALNDVATREYDWKSGPLSQLPLGRRLVLITAHRRESFGDPFRELCLAIRVLGGMFAKEGVRFVYPVHLNPNVQQPVRDILSGLSNVSLIMATGRPRGGSYRFFWSGQVCNARPRDGRSSLKRSLRHNSLFSVPC